MIIEFFRQLFRRRLPLSAFGRTDTGRVRPHNEDSLGLLNDRRLFLVADGMGGHNAGEVASQAAIEFLATFLTAKKIRAMGGKPEAIRHTLISAFRQANERIMTMAAEDPAQAGMGCTLIAALLDDRQLYTCHVGDVRAYLIAAGTIRQITEDHSLAAEYERKRVAGDPDLPPFPPARNIVTRVMGFPFAQDPETHELAVTAGARILLCSDGLWSMVPDPEILALVTAATGAEEACDRLVARANEAGGRDNITAIVITVGRDSET